MQMGDERSLRRLWDLYNVFSGEWISDIMVALSSGPLRRTDLLDTIRGTTVHNGWTNSSTRNLSDKVLQNTLHRMENSELIEHTRDESEFPVKSWYQLTTAGMELLHALEAPAQWAERHDVLITRVQQRRGGDRV